MHALLARAHPGPADSCDHSYADSYNARRRVGVPPASLQLHPSCVRVRTYVRQFTRHAPTFRRAPSRVLCFTLGIFRISLAHEGLAPAPGSVARSLLTRERDLRFRGFRHGRCYSRDRRSGACPALHAAGRRHCGRDRRRGRRGRRLLPAAGGKAEVRGRDEKGDGKRPRRRRPPMYVEVRSAVRRQFRSRRA